MNIKELLESNDVSNITFVLDLNDIKYTLSYNKDIYIDENSQSQFTRLIQDNNLTCYKFNSPAIFKLYDYRFKFYNK